MGLSELGFGSVTESIDTISSVEGGPDLLIGLNEPLELAVKISVLSTEDVAVILEGGDLSCTIVISSLEALVAESEFILLSSSNGQIFFMVAVLGLKVVQVAGQGSVAAEFCFAAGNKFGLLVHLKIESAGELPLVFSKSVVLVSGPEKVSCGGVVLLAGPPELTVSVFGEFRKLSGSLLGLEEIIVVSFDPGVSLGIFTLLEAVEIAETVSFLLVAGSLFSKLGELEVEVVDVFSKHVAGV